MLQTSKSFVCFGIFLGVLASMCGTAGKQLLRFSELLKKRGAFFMSKVALATGLALNMIVGPLVDMGSYAFAPQSLIAPLGGLDVIWNTLTAPCTLGEKLTPLLVIGCAFIASGATVTSTSGAHQEEDFTLQFIQDTFQRPAVGTYALAFIAWILFNILVLMPRSSAPKGEPWATGDVLRGLSLGMVAGSIAGNMFCVKAFVALVKNSIGTGSAENFVHWLPYVLLIGAIFFATTNLYFLAKAMQEYEALFMGAVYEGSLILAASISGCIVFSELEDLSSTRMVAYFAGLSLIVCGIFTVVYGVKAKQPPNGIDVNAAVPTQGKQGEEIDDHVCPFSASTDSSSGCDSSSSGSLSD